MSESVNSTDDAIYDIRRQFSRKLVKEVQQRALPLLKERLDDYGLTHSCSSADYARELAQVYQTDPNQAYIAALLHDWDRCVPKDQLIERAKQIGFEITPEICAAPQILHAHTGAADVQRHFPELPESVITAIRHHTVGAKDMSDLDKVVYVADMIEPNRVGPQVLELRELVGVIDLDALFLRAYQATMFHLIKNKKVMHFDTTRVWNALIMKGIA